MQSKTNILLLCMREACIWSICNRSFLEDIFLKNYNTMVFRLHIIAKLIFSECWNLSSCYDEWLRVRVLFVCMCVRERQSFTHEIEVLWPFWRDYCLLCAILVNGEKMSSWVMLEISLMEKSSTELYVHVFQLPFNHRAWEVISVNAFFIKLMKGKAITLVEWSLTWMNYTCRV